MLEGTFRKFMALSVAAAALVIGIACSVTPSDVSAQAARPPTFIVQHEPATDGQPYGRTRISTLENCRGTIDFNKREAQTFTCTLQQRECVACPYSDPAKCKAERSAASPGKKSYPYCPFLIQSTDRLPIPLTIGQSAHSPDCVYFVYPDWTGGQPIAIYYPC